MFTLILRKVPFHFNLYKPTTTIIIRPPPLIFSLLPNMESSSSSSSSSQRLAALAQQLRLYTPPPEMTDDDDDDIEKESGKVVAEVGFAESSNPIGQNLEKKLGEKEVVDQNKWFKPKRAAVLVCLFEDDLGVLRVILTKRSSKLSTHSGEVALPGGKAEEGDKDDAETATREAEEEIGLDPSLVNVVTTLEPFLSKHLLRVVPVIAILSDKETFKPIPNTAEVEEVFDAPLEMFLKDEFRRSEEREWIGYKYFVHYFDYETDNKKFLIWGLTASILIRAAAVVYQKSPPFLEQNHQFFKIPKNVEKDTVMP